MEAQVALNQRASEAAASGDYDKAILLLESSLDFGAWNVIYLNLGRVYYKAGRCQEALETFEKVGEVPAVQSPPPEAINAALERYRADIPEGCPGSLRVLCEGEVSQVRLEGQEVACGQTLSLKAGEHMIEARRGEQVRLFAVSVSGMGASEVVVALPAPSAVNLAPDPARDEAEVEAELGDPGDGPSEPVALSTWGWVTAGTGAALLVTGGIYFASYGELYDEIRDLSATPGGDRARYDLLKGEISMGNAVTTAFMVAGGVALAVGGGLVWWDWSSPAEASAARWSVGPGWVGVEVPWR